MDCAARTWTEVVLLGTTGTVVHRSFACDDHAGEVLLGLLWPLDGD